MPTVTPLDPVQTRHPAAVAARWFVRALQIAANAAALLALAATAFVIYRESTWLPPAASAAGLDDKTRNERSFFHGTIGTEVVPLPVLLVLPELTAAPDGGPSHFYPFGAKGGSWSDQFGFLPASMAPAAAPVDPRAKDLPLGFTVSHYRPKSGAPSPVVFVGLACATCHTTRINSKLVVGTGNIALNLFAWIDAFQAALRDERLTYDAILTAYGTHSEYPPLSFEEKGMIWLWLKGAQAKLAEDVTRYDEPYGNGLSMLPTIVPTGPCRTQPFRTLVRTLLDRPGSDMKVYTKIAAIYREGKEEWGQFDGGIHGLYRRSAGAALAAGATPQNLSLPEIADNIKWASDFVSNLDGPAWNDVFPDQPVNPTSPTVLKGKQVYMDHCNRCHGHPEGNEWVTKGTRVGERIRYGEIGTDPQRVTFRYYGETIDALSTYFPKDHPFDFRRDELFPPPGTPVAERGFINKQMRSMFSRAPYLHDASILTLAELINLEPRKAIFYRGANEYDTKLVGLHSAEAIPGKVYFLFDTTAPGNSNLGHDYPWPRSEVEKRPEKQEILKDLLEYLKTL
jgi:mono/diheme cytochrome c family protein